MYIIMLGNLDAQLLRAWMCFSRTLRLRCKLAVH